MSKEHTIIKHRRGTAYEVIGTLEYLTNYFGYTLECGNSYNSKIPRNPKTARSLVSSLNKSKDETQRGSYDPDWYELKII